jgi:hypothetical protein
MTFWTHNSTTNRAKRFLLFVFARSLTNKVCEKENSYSSKTVLKEGLNVDWSSSDNER